MRLTKRIWPKQSQKQAFIAIHNQPSNWLCVKGFIDEKRFVPVVAAKKTKPIFIWTALMGRVIQKIHVVLAKAI